MDDPVLDIVLDHLAAERLVLWDELHDALLAAVAQRDEARAERDTLAARLAIAIGGQP